MNCYFQPKMIIKLLSIITLIHIARSQPQFGKFGDLLRGGSNNSPADRLGGPLPALPKVGQDGLPIGETAERLRVGLNRIKLGFGDFKTLFKRTYISPIEEAVRQEIFSKITKVISDHNELFAKGLEKFSLAVNQFSDWKLTEFLEIQGFDQSEISEEQRGRRKRQMAGICDSPDEKNWIKEGAVTPIKDQLKCASCWAFSAAGALEGQFFRKNRVLKSLSEQQFVDCSKDLGNKGCNKGSMSTAFKYAQSKGIVTDNEYPYEGKDSICRASTSTLRITGIETIPAGDEETLKDAVCRIGPIAAAIDATSEKFKQYSDGVYFNLDCNPNNITHAILVVGYGYDDATELDYWIIKNSFGTTWGKDGYGKVARNMKSHCGIAHVASYPVV